MQLASRSRCSRSRELAPERKERSRDTAGYLQCRTVTIGIRTKPIPRRWSIFWIEVLPLA